jgi:hypothetical protein
MQQPTQPKIDVDVVRMLGVRDVEIAGRDVAIGRLQEELRQAREALRVADAEVRRLREKYEPAGPPAAG